MKIYHTATQEDYNALMVELEEKGYKWADGEMPTEHSYFDKYDSETTVTADASIFGKFIQYADVAYEIEDRPNEPIIEYKAKGENMTQEEMKHNLQKNAFDVSVAIESFARGISESEADLKEAKSSAKKLIEKIDEYLESQKPKFKVGDYVALHAFNKEIAKIEKIYGDKIHGLWYNTESESIRQDYYFGSGTAVKHATPEEIAEYEAALTFHKHGRDPFEVRQGDIISYNESDKFIVDYEDIEPEFETFDKEKFIRGDLTFLKTVEEVNEWLENK